MKCGVCNKDITNLKSYMDPAVEKRGNQGKDLGLFILCKKCFKKCFDSKR